MTQQSRSRPYTTMATTTTTTTAADSTISKPDLLLDRLTRNAIKTPNKPLFSFIAPGPNGGKIQTSLTYYEVARSTSELAQRLLDEGIQKGDRYVAVSFYFHPCKYSGRMEMGMRLDGSFVVCFMSVVCLWRKQCQNGFGGCS